MLRWHCVWGRRSVQRGGTVFPLMPWRVQGRVIGPPALGLGLVSRFRVCWVRMAALRGLCLERAASCPGEPGFGVPDLGILQ